MQGRRLALLIAILLCHCKSHTEAQLKDDEVVNTFPGYWKIGDLSFRAQDSPSEEQLKTIETRLKELAPAIKGFKFKKTIDLIVTQPREKPVKSTFSSNRFFSRPDDRFNLKLNILDDPRLPNNEKIVRYMARCIELQAKVEGYEDAFRKTAAMDNIYLELAGEESLKGLERLAKEAEAILPFLPKDKGAFERIYLGVPSETQVSITKSDNKKYLHISRFWTKKDPNAIKKALEEQK